MFKEIEHKEIVRMNKKELKKLIEKGESRNLEFKESLSLKNEIGESVSGFANTCDGIILIGVSDEREIKGVQIGKKTIEGLANFIKQNTDNSIYSDISVEEIEEDNIIVMKIKEQDEKPVFFRGKAYKRVGKSNHKLSASEIRKLAKESSKSYWDEEVCEDGLEDVDEEKLKWFLRKAKEARNFDVEPETPVKEALERLKLMKNGKLTNASILLFGKEPQKFFMQSEVRCARFKGIEPIEFIDMKVFGGSVIEQRDDVVEFVKEHIKLHAKIIDVERVEEWEYPIEAIREAVTNALCHRDYEIASNVQVRVFDDRIEVWGCGLLPKPLTINDLKKKHDSVLRNPLIGKCLFLIKYIEQWGTGTNRMIKECLEHKFPEPLFELIAGNLVVTFRKYKVTEDVIKDLDDRQKNAIKYLLEHKKITNKEYRKINPNITDRTVLNDFNELINKNIIIAKGKKKFRYYELK